MIYDPYKILELDQTFRRNREEAEAAHDAAKYKFRIAQAAQMKKKQELERRIKERDVIQLLNLGCD